MGILIHGRWYLYWNRARMTVLNARQIAFSAVQGEWEIVYVPKALIPDSSALDGPHVGPMNLAIRDSLLNVIVISLQTAEKWHCLWGIVWGVFSASKGQTLTNILPLLFCCCHTAGIILCHLSWNDPWHCTLYHGIYGHDLSGAPFTGMVEL